MQRGTKLRIVLAGVLAIVGVSGVGAQDFDREELGPRTKDGGASDADLKLAKPRREASPDDFIDERAREVLPDLLKWAGPTGRTTVFDRRCRSILVRRDEGVLEGQIPSRPRKGELWYGVSFGIHVVLTGPNVRGGPTLASAEPLTNGLWKVTRDAAWYTGEHPLLFSSRRACQRYRRQHRIDADDIDVLDL